MYTADFSKGATGFYVIYSTKERKILNFVYRDTLMRGKFIYDIKPFPNNKDQLYCTIYQKGLAVVGYIDVQSGNDFWLSEAYLFQSDKPDFFYLDDACENVYMSHSINSGIIDVPVAYKFGVEDYPRFDLTDLASAHYEFGKTPKCKVQGHQLLCTSLDKNARLQFQGFGPIDFSRSMKSSDEVKTSEIVDCGLSHNSLIVNVFRVANGKNQGRCCSC